MLPDALLPATGSSLRSKCIYPETNRSNRPSPIAIVITPGGAGAPVAQRDAGFFGHIGKRAVVVVVEEPVVAIVGHEYVGPAVVIEVADCYAEAPTVVGNTSVGGDIGEGSIVVVVKERRVGQGLLAVQGIEGCSVDKVDIKPAVVVVVEQRYA